jgi:hypothetical protein
MLIKNEITLINIPDKKNCCDSNKSITRNKNVCTELYRNNSVVLSYTSCDKSSINSRSQNFYSKIYSTYYDVNAISILDAADGFNVYGAIIVSNILLCGKVEGYSSNTIVSTIAWSTLASVVGTLENYSSESFLQKAITVPRFSVFVPEDMFPSFDKDIIKHKN